VQPLQKSEAAAARKRTYTAQVNGLARIVVEGSLEQPGMTD